MGKCVFCFLEKMTRLSRCVSKMVLTATLIMVVVFVLDILLFYTMRVSISPFDEDVFGKFWPPSDMFVPEIDVPIGVGETSYKFEYRHRYSGRHMICLRLERYPMNAEVFFNSSRDVTFHGEIVITGQPSSRVNFEKSVKGEIYRCGNDSIDEIPLFRYDELGGRVFKDTYNVWIKLDGDMTHFLKFYKRCSISVRNDTHL